MIESATVIPLTDRSGEKVAPAQRVESGGELFQGLANEIPTCPGHLSAEAKKHWRYMAKELKKANMIARIDQGTLANLCTYWARARDAEIQLQASGEFQKTPNNYVQLSPYAVAFQRYSCEYNKLAQKFGMTPMARKGVKAENPNQGDLNLD